MRVLSPEAYFRHYWRTSPPVLDLFESLLAARTAAAEGEAEGGPTGVDAYPAYLGEAALDSQLAEGQLLQVRPGDSHLRSYNAMAWLGAGRE